jgi:hypothetical protein
MPPIPKQLNFFYKIKGEQLRLAVESILQYTIQFFTEKDGGQYAGVGSGLLLTADNRFFMITAAHVIAEQYEKVFVILGDKEQQLGGKLVSTPLPASGKRIDDKIDISIMELLDNNLITTIQANYSFLTLSDLDIDHKVSGPYLSVGFPAAKTKSYKGKLEVAPYPLQADVREDFDYVKLGFNPLTHIALMFEGGVVSASNPVPHKTPAMNGVSGSGVWHNGNYLKGDPVTQKKLVGIFIEKSASHNRTVMMVTRIAVVTEMLRQAFRLNVQQSKTVKFTLGNGLTGGL